jgi:hypothetical protein
MLRYEISSSFTEVVLSARIAFSKRSWPYLLATAVPWLLCAGQRAVSRLAALGAHRRSRSGYYRFLSAGKWRLPLLFRALFELIVRTFGLVELTLVLDDTLCPKWGRGIFGTGCFFDHAARPRPGYRWGHNWVVLALVVQIGPCGWAALPFWIALYRPAQSCPPDAFRTRHQLAAEALTAVRAWTSSRITLLADGAYGNASLVAPARELGIGLVSRLRRNTRLRRARTPRRAPGRRGRRPKWGPPLPSLRRLARARRAFRRERVAIYGRTVTLLLREFVAAWPALGGVVKVVITRDPRRAGRVAYLMTTDLGLSAVEVVERFARRWTIETLFAAAKNQLGLDSAEVRLERSVKRHAALCLALATWTEVWAHRERPRLRARSFATKLAALREDTVKQTIFASGPRTQDSRRIAAGLATLYATATSAA